MPEIQVGDGMGGPITYDNPCRWKYITNTLNQYLTKKAGENSVEGAICRRLNYCMNNWGFERYDNILDLTPPQKQRIITDERAVRDFLAIDRSKDPQLAMINVESLNYVHDVLVRMLQSALFTKVDESYRSEHLFGWNCFQHRESIVIRSENVKTYHLVGSTWIISFFSDNDKDSKRTYESLLSITEPFNLRGLTFIKPSNNVHTAFRRCPVMFVVTNPANSSEMHMCVRNVKEVEIINDKGRRATVSIDHKDKFSSDTRKLYEANLKIAEGMWEEVMKRRSTHG